MKLIKQTKFGKEGNCLFANIATLLNIPIESCPYVPHNDDWQKNINAWLIPTHEYYLITVNAEGYPIHPGVYYLAAGKTSRGLMHSVIYKDGKLFHDPHPSNIGIDRIEEYDLLVPTFKEKKLSDYILPFLRIR